MTQLRDLWADLVDKRLWPVAAVLLAAVVAIPLVLAKPAPKNAARPAPLASTAAVPPPPGAAAAIADVTGTAYLGPVKGSAKDPFRPQGGTGGSSGGVASVASAIGSTSAGSTSATAGSGTSGSTSSGSGAGSGKTTTTPAAPAVEPDVVAALQFGLLGGAPIARRVAELTPLPSPTSPAVVYLGQTKKGESAFLVTSDVKPAGQGRCAPTRATCSTLYLRPGQVEYLTVATTSGREIRYRLKFVKRVY